MQRRDWIFVYSLFVNIKTNRIHQTNRQKRHRICILRKQCSLLKLIWYIMVYNMVYKPNDNYCYYSNAHVHGYFKRAGKILEKLTILIWRNMTSRWHFKGNEFRFVYRPEPLTPGYNVTLFNPCKFEIKQRYFLWIGSSHPWHRNLWNR